MNLEMMVKLINIALLVVLLLLVRKLIWCLRWLWCYYHGREVPEPISLLPARSGRAFETRIQQAADDRDSDMRQV